MRASSRAIVPFLSACASAVLVSSCAQSPIESEGRHRVADNDHGRALYATHCAVCHGTTGAGDGPAYGWLFPRARDFTSGTFRLVSTDNGVPTRADLIRTLRRGMPGSAMPSWAWMSEADLGALADHVRDLAVEGRIERLREEAYLAGESLDPESARERAVAALRPGQPLLRISEPTADSRNLERGRRLYSQGCAACHGAGGEGDASPRLNDDGSLNWPRDLTGGYLKGGASAEQLGYRILAGLPGTPMPATNLPPEDVAALVAYLRELIPAGTEDRFVQTRTTITARRVEGDLPGLGDPSWSSVPEARIVVTPLAWRLDSVHEVGLSAMHDGSRISIRVRWEDPTGGENACVDTTSFDAVALQLSQADRPPLFGMGSHEEPTSIWHWKAARFEDTAGVLDLLGLAPHGAREPVPGQAVPDAVRYRRSLGSPSTRADSASGRGIGSPTDAGESGLAVAPQWSDGTWEVIFTRDLESPGGDELALVPGRPLHLALAVWSCDAGDRAGQKSISIWHALELE